MQKMILALTGRQRYWLEHVQACPWFVDHIKSRFLDRTDETVDEQTAMGSPGAAPRPDFFRRLRQACSRDRRCPLTFTAWTCYPTYNAFNARVSPGLPPHCIDT